MSGPERGVRRKKQVPKRQRMDLPHVPGAENAGVECKPSDPGALVLGEIHNIAEDHDELGRKERKKDSNNGKENGRGGGWRRSGTNNDDEPSDKFFDGEDSDAEDSEVDELRVYRKKPRPVRHCKSLYSDIGPRKSTTLVTDGDDNSNSDDDTNDDDDDSDDTNDDEDDDDSDDDDDNESDDDSDDVTGDDNDDDDDDDDDEDEDDDDDETYNDKEDAKEKYVKETLKKGRPCKRSLDKDLRDASNTLSGRMTRSRTKSITDSSKQSSESYEEHASSSKGPVTASVIETDDESDDDDDIKPVSLSAKKSNKIDSDSDSDSDDSLPSLESPSSMGKRKGSDSDGDDEDDGKDKNKSSKKKFKRTKRKVTSSQEIEKYVDSTEKKRVRTKKTNGAQDSSRSSSCSSSSGPDTDSSDSSSSGTNSGEYSNFIAELREELGDDGTLDMLRHYILWFALKAGGENIDDEFNETVDAKTKLDRRLEAYMNICQSQAWGTNFRADVMEYPKFVDYIKREDLRGGDMRYLGNCQVCNRESHPWSMIVKLEGEPYNKETFEMIVNEDEEDSVELPPVQYYMGCFCHPRSKLYHNLYHFGYHLYQRCKEMLEELVHDKRRIDTVVKDKSLLREMYTKLKKWMNEAKKDYTTENGERANNKWAREYKELI